MSHVVSPEDVMEPLHREPDTAAAHAGARIAHAGDHDIIECSICGFKHALPLPDPAALAREYAENYYAAEKPDFIAHAREDQDWFQLAQTDRLEVFEKLLGPGRRRLLDIGCGPGFFLKTALARAAGRRRASNPRAGRVRTCARIGCRCGRGIFLGRHRAEARSV